MLKGIQPLGKITDYFARVEFQYRGSPHIHMFFWIENVPNKIDDQNIVQLKNYINASISSVIPDRSTDSEMHDLVKKLQTHSHTPYCSNNYKSKCRFGFPNQQSTETNIFANIDLSKRKKIKFRRRFKQFNIQCGGN